jgi:hypothetical protein
MTPSPRFPVRPLRLLVPALFLSLVACPTSKTTDTPATAPPAGAVADVTLSLNAADPGGKRYASVKIQPKVALAEATLAFDLPTGCNVIAGAAVRTVKNLTVGTPMSQELGFQCEAGATGTAKATFKTTDPGTGKPVEIAMQADL